MADRSPCPEEGEAPEPLRARYTAELDQLRLQVEVMAVRVAAAVAGAADVLATGDEERAARIVAADDDVDAMLVSLTARAYELISRESPVASDLRFLVSVLRMLEELERIGDLALRVVKLAPDQPSLTRHPEVLGTLRQMADVARELYDRAVEAWSAQDLDLACTLVTRQRAMDAHYAQLLEHILDLDGADAAAVAVTAVLAGRALERIADHTVIIGERLRYLLTGDPAFLASEVR